MPSGSPTSFIPSTDLVNASPNTMFTYFLFHRWDVYLDSMMKPESIDIDSATASLLATCTDTARRIKFWDDYIALKQKPNMTQVNASILISGEFFSYVADMCEFVEKSYGGAV